MANALECYLNDFYNDPNNVEEYKIIFLKNHYYPKINIILNTEFKNFKIGVKKNRNILWFIDENNPKNEIIYKIKEEEYFLRNKEANKLEKIDYNSYIDNSINISDIKENQLNKTCFSICILS
mgnify:FL=1|tara:strand:+ start:4801 stop:5169 length:369 start_codon:yes stop_codon:yes gene_type:complete